MASKHCQCPATALLGLLLSSSDVEVLGFHGACSFLAQQPECLDCQPERFLWLSFELLLSSPRGKLGNASSLMPPVETLWGMDRANKHSGPSFLEERWGDVILRNLRSSSKGHEWDGVPAALRDNVLMGTPSSPHSFLCASWDHLPKYTYPQIFTSVFGFEAPRTRADDVLHMICVSTVFSSCSRLVSAQKACPVHGLHCDL